MYICIYIYIYICIYTLNREREREIILHTRYYIMSAFESLETPVS